MSKNRAFWGKFASPEFLMAIYGTAMSSVAFFKDERVPDALIFCFGMYILVLAALLVWREHTYSRKARYAETTGVLHQVAEAMRDAHDAAIRRDERAFKERMTMLVNLFSQAFSVVTAAHCRASIKTIVAVNDPKGTNYYTEDFCRSGDGFAENPQQSPITENIDFELLFKKDRDFYFSNDLSDENPYYNSNWPNDAEERRKFFKTKRNTYISTMVWPIRGPMYGDGLPIIGFLCIDSNTRGIFEPRYDKEYGAVIADMLYTLMKCYFESATPVETGQPHQAA